MTPLDKLLAELDMLHEAATSGPFHSAPGEYERTALRANFKDGSGTFGVGQIYHPEDANLLIALRNAYPQLRAHLRAASVSAEDWEDSFHDCDKKCGQLQAEREEARNRALEEAVEVVIKNFRNGTTANTEFEILALKVKS